jgi:diaminohydroxyphosphoribosylaminopyrimidine deaminase/5-amino-6-(5-phosphoribosylamino)uracil reductase
MSAVSTAPFTAQDHAHMARALELAARGLYTTKPNPAVGCVLVRGSEIVATGYTQPAGGPHAERVALAAAGERARGATAYVTLEPCCHQGRTGPCTRALLGAGIARVVYAVRDPNPLVGGGGAQALEQAGVAVAGGLLARAAEDLNRGFFARMQRGRPWVRSKLAASLDGRTALANGASRWITGDAARRDVHRFRARAGAILTGSGTVRLDDPALTARLDDPGVDVRQPLRVVLDSRFAMPPGARVLAGAGQALVLGAVADAAREQALTAAGARVERVPAVNGRCDLGAVLARLAALEVNDVWVEAGATLNGALLAAGLIDEMLLYVAPRIFGSAARGMFDLPELAALEEAVQLEFTDVRRVGPDLRITARPSSVAPR